MGKRLDQLSDEYEVWLGYMGIPEKQRMCALETSFEIAAAFHGDEGGSKVAPAWNDRPKEQLKSAMEWISDFNNRWEAAEDAERKQRA